MQHFSKLIIGCMLMMPMTLSVEAFTLNVETDESLKKVFVSERFGLGRTFLKAGTNEIALEHYPNVVSLMKKERGTEVVLRRVWVDSADANIIVSIDNDYKTFLENPSKEQLDLDKIFENYDTYAVFPYENPEERTVWPILALEAKSIIQDLMTNTSRELLKSYSSLASRRNITFWATDVINAYLRKPSDYFYSNEKLHQIEAKNGQEHVVSVKPDGSRYWLVAVSGSWCGPCLKGIPDMRKAYNELNGEVEFISLWNDTDLDTFLNNHKDKKETIVWTNLWDQYGLMANSMNVQAYPSYLLFDPSGKEIGRWEKLLGNLEKFLSK